MASEGMRKVYAPKGTGLVEGNIIKMVDLSNTLYTIATEGVDAFYTGTIAQNLINDILQAGGNITLEDLANYTAVVRHESELS